MNAPTDYEKTITIDHVARVPASRGGTRMDLACRRPARLAAGSH
jgi:hypothetical protein